MKSRLKIQSAPENPNSEKRLQVLLVLSTDSSSKFENFKYLKLYECLCKSVCVTA